MSAASKPLIQLLCRALNILVSRGGDGNLLDELDTDKLDIDDFDIDEHDIFESETREVKNKTFLLSFFLISNLLIRLVSCLSCLYAFSWVE